MPKGHRYLRRTLEIGHPQNFIIKQERISLKALLSLRYYFLSLLDWTKKERKNKK